MAINVNDAVNVGQMNTILNRINTAIGESFRSASVSGNTVSFFNSKDGTGDAAFTFDFPEELYLAQTGTEIVENFAWSAATYPGSTNPNLDGKTVLVLAVQGNKATNPTVTYSFVDMAKVIEVITAGDNSITVDGYAISVKVSPDTGNLFQVKANGVYVGSDTLKADKVVGATAGHIATLDANGNLVDSGVSFASDADVNEMLNNIFGAPSGGGEG